MFVGGFVPGAGEPVELLSVGGLMSGRASMAQQVDGLLVGLAVIGWVVRRSAGRGRRSNGRRG